MSDYTKTLTAKQLIHMIACDQPELSHDKVLSQRNEYIKVCREWLDTNCETVEEDDPLKYLTLDTYKFGIWLIDDLPEGPQQLGYIPWKTIAQGIQNED